MWIRSLPRSPQLKAKVHNVGERLTATPTVSHHPPQDPQLRAALRRLREPRETEREARLGVAGVGGPVINVVPRTGGNRFAGSYFTSYTGTRLFDVNTDAYDHLNTSNLREKDYDVNGAFGGPLVRDRLWFFGSYQPGIRNTERTVNFENGVTNTFDQDFKVHYGAANVTGNVGSKVLYRVGANFSPFETERSLPTQTGQTSLTTAESYLRGTKGDRRTFSGSVDYIPSSRLAFSARAGRFLTDEESTGVTFPGIIHNISTSSTAASRRATIACRSTMAGATLRSKWTRATGNWRSEKGPP